VSTRPSIDSSRVFASLAATLTVPGCDRASLMIQRDGRRKTAAVSDSIARQIDRLELTLGTGPCMDVLDSRTAQIEPDLAASDLWPALTKRVVTETPVRGAMSVLMLVDHSKVGALNLFSDIADAFDNTSLEHAVVLGAFATVATTAAARSEEAATLRRGLTSNRAIGKAVGIVMALNDVSDDDAFDILRRTSQASNVKLIDIASDIVSGRRWHGSDRSA
jgi:hypothetical protein